MKKGVQSLVKALFTSTAFLTLLPTMSWATCTDSPTNVNTNKNGASATDGSICNANQTSYMGRWPVYARGQGSVLNFTHDTVTVQGYPFNAHHIIAIDGAQINFNNLYLKLDTYVGQANYGVRGIYAGNYGGGNNPATITINGNFTAKLTTTNGIAAAIETDHGYSVIVKGKTDIVLNRNVPNAIISQNGSTVYFAGDTKIYSLNKNLTAETNSSIKIDGAVNFWTTFGLWNVSASSGEKFS